MSNNPHEVFATPQDYWNWDKYVQQCDLIELNKSNRQRSKEAFQYLRGVLGESFLKRAEKQRNPMFFWYFTDASPRARLSLIRLTDALKELENVPNFKTLLRRIKKSIKKPEDLDEIAEGRSVIEVAHKFSKAGFVVEFEPVVNVTNHRGVVGPKKPDIRIVNKDAGEEIIVEVSRLRASAHQNLTGRTYDVIWNLLVREGMWYDPEALKDILHPRYILPYALIHRGIQDDELKGIVSSIRELIERVRTNGEFGELIIPDTLEVGIASYDNHESAREWAAARGLKDSVKGPDILSDEIARAKMKIREKLGQLPDDRPGVIVIRPENENLIFFIYDIRWLIAALAEEVQKYSKLFSVIMFHTYSGSQEDGALSVDVGPHTFTRRVRSDGAIEQSVIIRNTTCVQVVTAETQEMIRSAFAFR